MRAVIVPEPGGPQNLQLVDRPEPVPGPGELLVDVVATSVNRADLLQRAGHYPPPPGASDVLGLELSGEVTGLGEGVSGWAIGDRVFAVVPGGGYAERALVPAAVALRVPDELDLVAAGGVAEVFLTAYDNLFVRGRLATGETVLLHGGSSGVGSAAIQLAVRAGCRVLVTASTAEKLEACQALGADAGINYAQQDFVERVRELTDGRGVDVLLDVVGGSYLERNLKALAVEGRLVVIGLQGGTRGELNLGRVLSRRLTVLGSTLRARTVAEKAPLVERFAAEVLPGFADASLRPVIDRVLPLTDVAEAHRVVEAGQHIGKVVLQVREHAAAPH